MNKVLLYIAVICTLCAAPEKTNAQNMEIEYEILFTSDDMDMSQMPLCTPPGMGLCTLIEGELTGLDSDVYDGAIKLPLHTNTIIDAISSWNNGLLLKTGNRAAWIDTDGKLSEMTFEDSDFTVFSGINNTFYFQKNGDSTLVEIDKDVEKPLRRFILDAPVTALTALPDSSIVLSTLNDLWLVSQNKKVLLHSHPSIINDFDVSPWGIFLGTQDGLWMLDYQGILYYLGSEPIRRTLFSAQSLYVIEYPSETSRLVFYDIKSA